MLTYTWLDDSNYSFARIVSDSLLQACQKRGAGLSRERDEEDAAYTGSDWRGEHDPENRGEAGGSGAPGEPGLCLRGDGDGHFHYGRESDREREGVPGGHQQGDGGKDHDTGRTALGSRKTGYEEDMV